MTWFAAVLVVVWILVFGFLVGLVLLFPIVCCSFICCTLLFAISVWSVLDLLWFCFDYLWFGLVVCVLDCGLLLVVSLRVVWICLFVFVVLVIVCCLGVWVSFVWITSWFCDLYLITSVFVLFWWFGWLVCC